MLASGPRYGQLIESGMSEACSTLAILFQDILEGIVLKPTYYRRGIY